MDYLQPLQTIWDYLCLNQAPEKADDLLKDFMELEKSLTAKIAELQ